MCNLLGLGHPRTGTAFTSKLLKKWGFDVGHEHLGSDGIVAWQLIETNGPYPYMAKVKCRPIYNFLIYNVRNPYESIPSIVYTEDTKPKSFNYRLKVLGFSESINPIENAILSIYNYDSIVSTFFPDFTFRIEDEQFKLYEFLLDKKFNLLRYSEHNQKENKRKHKSFNEMIKEFGCVSSNAKKLINDFCIKYGYTKLF